MSPRPNAREVTAGSDTGEDDPNNAGGGGELPPASAGGVADDAEALAMEWPGAPSAAQGPEALPDPSSPSSSTLDGSGGGGTAHPARPEPGVAADGTQQRRRSAHGPSNVRTSPTGRPSPEGSEQRRPAVSSPQREGRLIMHDDDVEEADGEVETEVAAAPNFTAPPREIGTEGNAAGGDLVSGNEEGRRTVAPPRLPSVVEDLVTAAAATEATVAAQLAAAAEASQRLRVETEHIPYRALEDQADAGVASRDGGSFSTNGVGGRRPTWNIDSGSSLTNDGDYGYDEDGDADADAGDTSNAEQPADVFTSWVGRVRRRRRNGISNRQSSGGATAVTSDQTRPLLQPREADGPAPSTAGRTPSTPTSSAGIMWSRGSFPEETTLHLLRGSYHVVNESRRREVDRRTRRGHRHDSGAVLGSAAGSDGNHDVDSCLTDLVDPRFATDACFDFRRPESVVGERSSDEEGYTDGSSDEEADGNKSRAELLVQGCHRTGGILDVDFIRSLLEAIPLDQVQVPNEDEAGWRSSLTQENVEGVSIDESGDQNQELVENLITLYISKLKSLRVPSSVPFVREQIRRAYVVQSMLIQSEERRLANELARKSDKVLYAGRTGGNSGDPRAEFGGGALAASECLANETKLTLTLGSVCMASLNSLLPLVEASPSLADPDTVALPLKALDTMTRSFFKPLCFYNECTSRCTDEKNTGNVWKVLKDLLSWLQKVCITPSMSKHRELAICTMLRICSATGMLSHILITIEAMLMNIISVDPIPADVVEDAPDSVGAITRQYLQGITDHMVTIKSSVAHDQQMSASLEDVRFDPTEMSQLGLSLARERTVVRSTTSQHTHCYLNRGFTTGKWAWEFLLLEDIDRDESTCLGAGLKPATNSSYNSSPNLWMYRCYNGNLYQRGSLLRNGGTSTSSNRRGKQRVHPNDVVRIQLDCTKQTLSYTINGTNEQGMCFYDVTGGPVYPAVSFYGSNRSVKLLCVESTEMYGRGVRFFRDDDIEKRKMWHGEMRCGKKHGTGVLSYQANRKPTTEFPEMSGFWCGYWRNDMQHGLSAWVLTDENGDVDVEACRLYWFEDGSMIRTASDEDKEEALVSLEREGWSCKKCTFVNTSGSACLVCGSLRIMPLPRAMQGGLQCKTLDSCCASILEHLGEVAVAQGKDSLKADGVGALYCSESGASSKETGIHSPYAVEACMDTFELLDRILAKFYHIGDDVKEGLPMIAKITTLQLLKANFDRLPPIPFEGAHQMDAVKGGGIGIEAKQSALRRIRQSLETLVKENGPIGQSAANSLASGFEMLFPDYECRGQIVCQLLTQHNASPLYTKSGQYALLKSLLTRFGSDESIGQLFPTGIHGKVEFALIEQVLQSLFDCIEHGGMRLIRGDNEDMLGCTASSTQDVANLSAAAMQLLLSVYRALLSELTVAETKQKKKSTTKISDHCIKLLLTFSEHVLRVSLRLCRRAEGESSYDDMESRLSQTMVFSILPFFVVASLFFSNELWFAEPVMPLVSKLVQELDGLNAAASKIHGVGQSLQSLEQRVIDEATINNMSGNELREVRAVFDDEHGRSDDIVISNHGRLLRSTSSSNQHCLVNVGVKQGRAAWEFQLVSDSQADECSAFGVATRPITSSVYESSPNMWVIRSYNGQCYNGTCSNFPRKSKIHPKDIVRFEVCMASKTMRFIKNGVDEGVAFTNLHGELFPLVCTYRMGVEVKLIKMEVWSEGSLPTSTALPSLPMTGKRGAWFDPPSTIDLVMDDLSRNFGAVSEGSVFTFTDRDSGKWASVIGRDGVFAGRHAWDIHLRKCTNKKIIVGVTVDRKSTDVNRECAGHNSEGIFFHADDGTLWEGSVKVSHSCQLSYSLGAGDCMGMLLDLDISRFIVLLNGKELVRQDLSSLIREGSEMFYPTVSLASNSDSVQVLASGSMSGTSMQLPWLLDMEKSLVFLGGKLGATLISGPPTEEDEGEETERWLQNPLVAVGPDINQNEGTHQRDLILNNISQGLTMWKRFYEWMEDILPEPQALRQHLAKRNSFDFPSCERPFIAAMLKHSGLWHEFVWLLEESSLLKPEVPSPGFACLRSKVTALRAALRRKRQELFSEKGLSESFESCEKEFSSQLKVVEERARFLLENAVDSDNLQSFKDSAEVSLDRREQIFALLASCSSYVMGGLPEAGPPCPTALKNVLERRTLRANSRCSGFKALLDLLNSCSSIVSVRQYALIFFKASMRGAGFFERGMPALSSRTNDPLTVTGGQIQERCLDDSRIRHHYLKGLESCPQQHLQRVQDSFWDLFSCLLGWMKDAATAGHIGLFSMILERLSIDVEPRDHANIQTILEVLHPLISVENAMAASSLCDASSLHHLVTLPERSLWPIENVRVGLLSSYVSRRMVAMHMLGKDTMRIWLASRGMRDVSDGIDMDISELILLYEKFYVACEEGKKEINHRLTTALKKEKEASRQARRRMRGVRWTYKVTASNGVGLRKRPHPSAERTGVSFKQQEEAEISWRCRLHSGQTFLRVAGDKGKDGWLFSVGVRTPYRGKAIMECVNTESYCVEEEVQRMEHAKHGQFLQSGASDGGTLVLENGLVAMHVPSGGHRSIRSSDDDSIGAALVNSIWYETPADPDELPEGAVKGGKAPMHYFEVICRSINMKCSSISIGFVDDSQEAKQMIEVGDNERANRDRTLVPSNYAGKIDGSFGFVLRGHTFWGNGREIISGSTDDTESSIPFRPTRIRDPIDYFRATCLPKRLRQSPAHDDVLGCGINFSTNEVVFTYNGIPMHRFIAPSITGKRLRPYVTVGNLEALELDCIGESGIKKCSDLLAATNDLPDAPSFECQNVEQLKNDDVISNNPLVADDQNKNAKSMKKSGDRLAFSPCFPGGMSLPQFNRLSDISWTFVRLLSFLSLSKASRFAIKEARSAKQPKESSEVNSRFNHLVRGKSLYGTEMLRTQRTTAALHIKFLTMLSSDIDTCRNILKSRGLPVSEYLEHISSHDGAMPKSIPFKLGAEPTSLFSDVIRVERHLYSRVRCLLSLVSSGSSAPRFICTSPSNLRCLIELLRDPSISARICRVLFRIFVYLVTFVSPEELDRVTSRESTTACDSSSATNELKSESAGFVGQAFVRLILDAVKRLFLFCSGPSCNKVELGNPETNLCVGSGRIEYTKAVQAACLLRKIMSSAVYKHGPGVCQRSQQDSRLGCTAWNVILSAIESSDLPLVSAALFVLSEREILRVGGMVRQNTSRNSLGLVVEYPGLVGADKGNGAWISRLRDHSAPKLVFVEDSTTIVPVCSAEDSVPSPPDENIARNLMRKLLTFLQSRKSAITTSLALSAMSTLMKHPLFSLACANDHEMARTVLNLSAQPLPLSHFVSLDELEHESQHLHHVVLETHGLNGRNVNTLADEKEMDPSASKHVFLCLPEKYQVVLPEGAVVRNGVSVDKSLRLKVLKEGTIVNVIDRYFSSEDQVMRLRITGHGKEGWISEKLRGQSPAVIAKAIGHAISDGPVEQMLPEDGTMQSQTSSFRFNGKAMMHRLHNYPLRCIPPISLYPQSPGWMCDYCEATFDPNIYAYVSQKSNFVLCVACFESDPNAYEAPGDDAQEEIANEVLPHSTSPTVAQDKCTSPLKPAHLDEDLGFGSFVDRAADNTPETRSDEVSASASMQRLSETKDTIEAQPLPIGNASMVQLTPAAKTSDTHLHVKEQQRLALSKYWKTIPLTTSPPGPSDQLRESVALMMTERSLFSFEACKLALLISKDDEDQAMSWLEEEAQKSKEGNRALGEHMHLHRPTYKTVMKTLGFDSRSHDSHSTKPHCADHSKFCVLNMFRGINSGTSTSSNEVEAPLVLDSSSRMDEDEHEHQFNAVFGGEDSHGFHCNGGVELGKKLVVDCTSEVHKAVCVVICSTCNFLEFPVCDKHQQLLSVAEDINAASKDCTEVKCSECSCSTSTRGPWNIGCRLCKFPTEKSLLALTLSEAQFLLRSFPPHLRTNKEDDLCRFGILKCHVCSAAGFPGVGGAYPKLCTAPEDYTKVERWQGYLHHIKHCPNTGGPLACIEVSTTFGEARYLHKTFPRCKRHASFRHRRQGLKQGMMVVLVNNDAMSTRKSILGNVRKDEEKEVGDMIAVDAVDSETGMILPTSLPSDSCYSVGGISGVNFSKKTTPVLREIVDRMNQIEAWMIPLCARECIIHLLVDISLAPQAEGLDCNSLRLSSLFRMQDSWATMLNLVALVLRSDMHALLRAKDRYDRCHGLGSWKDAPEARFVSVTSLRRLHLADDMAMSIIHWSHQFREKGGSDLQGLFDALLTSSLSAFDDLASNGDGDGSKLSDSVTRDSLHPHLGSKNYRFGEVIQIKPQEEQRLSQLRVIFNRRTKLREGTSLKFWKCFDDAASGQKPVCTINGTKDYEEEDTGQLQDLVVQSDSVFYAYDGNDSSLRSREDIPTNAAHNHTKLYPVFSALRTGLSHAPSPIGSNNIVSCTEGFPSFALNDVLLTHGCWYYECIIVTSGLAQLGWSDTQFTADSMLGNGVGDDSHSWGFDGSRVYKWHRGGARWGRAWNEGDVIGLLLDIDRRTMSFSINGDLGAPLGVAFTDVVFVGGLRPCMTLNNSCSFRCNFGSAGSGGGNGLKHLPDGYQPVMKAALAGNAIFGYGFEVQSVQEQEQIRTLPFCHCHKLGTLVGLTFWRGKSRRNDVKSLGDIYTFDGGCPASVLGVIEEIGNPALAKPEAFEKVLIKDLMNEGKYFRGHFDVAGKKGALWRPIPPPNFTAMGFVFTSGSPPDASVIRCVRNDCVSQIDKDRASADGWTCEKDIISQKPNNMFANAVVMNLILPYQEDSDHSESSPVLAHDSWRNYWLQASCNVLSKVVLSERCGPKAHRLATSALVRMFGEITESKQASLPLKTNISYIRKLGMGMNYAFERCSMQYQQGMMFLSRDLLAIWEMIILAQKVVADHAVEDSSQAISSEKVRAYLEIMSAMARFRMSENTDGSPKSSVTCLNHFLGTNWSFSDLQDASLVEWMDDCLKEKESILDLNVRSLLSTLNQKNAPASLSWIEGVPKHLIQQHVLGIIRLNQALSDCLHLIDLTSSQTSSIGRALRLNSHLILRGTKARFLASSLERTLGVGGSVVTVRLDNFLASRSIQNGETSITTSRNIFVQAFRVLQHKPPSVLRSIWDGDRVFQVTFKGESGSDAGGVFREGLSRMVEDLFHDHFDLFVRCANGVQGVGLSQDVYIPNPKWANDELESALEAMQMFEFVGKLMGLSLRTGLSLPFQFPSIVWKTLASHELSMEDLNEIDQFCSFWLKDILHCSKENWEHDFGSTLSWSCTGSSGDLIALPNPKMDQRVTFDERHRFVEEVLGARFGEVGEQLAGISRGFFCVVPERAIVIYSPQQIADMVCGDPVIDVDDWIQNTQYNGYTLDDQTIQIFWDVVRRLSGKERSLLLRFAWGRSRLPPKGEWPSRFHIAKRGGINDLIHAHTCFAAIDLPPYTTMEKMEWAIGVAVKFGTVGVLNT